MVNFDNLLSKKEKICVVGLGYVGLPLAVLLAKKFAVVGFDINKQRIEELKKGIDKTGEVNESELKNTNIEFSADSEIIKTASFIILAIPTPVDKDNRPDLGLVEKATVMVGKNLRQGAIIVYESTVYPGVTEDICLPILEKESGLKGGIDFKIGYSPERVNPGDKEHGIDKIIKIVSGQDQESLQIIAGVYGAITTVYEASSIKVAEAAKVIENTQRDLNIALMNELSVIFHKMDIDTKEVLKAAGTKWNFLKFYPGLVGGHCIGVDPYYLTYKAEQIGYNPEVILAGRRINDFMGKWIVDELIKKAVELGKNISKLKVLIAGFTFKENVPDIRNSKVFDIYKALISLGLKPVVYDPIADIIETKREYGLDLVNSLSSELFDVVVVAVSHNEFKDKKIDDWKKLMSGQQSLLADVKGIYNSQEASELGIVYWRL